MGLPGFESYGRGASSVLLFFSPSSGKIMLPGQGQAAPWTWLKALGLYVGGWGVDFSSPCPPRALNQEEAPYIPSITAPFSISAQTPPLRLLLPWDTPPQPLSDPLS